MATTVSTETTTIINIEATATPTPTTTSNRILDGNTGSNIEGDSSNSNNTGDTPTVTPGTTSSSTSTATATATPTTTPNRILDGNNGNNTSVVTEEPGNTEEPGITTTTSKTPSFTRLPGIHRYFPNYTNKLDTEISLDILALKEIGIMPIATKANEIYYNTEELIVYYAYYINELSYTSNYEFESIDDAVNAAISYINQIEGRDGESFWIGILHKENYEYQTNYTKSLPTTTTSQPVTTPTTTAVKPTSIPAISVYADDGKNYNGGKYLTYKATGAVNESDTVMSLPRTLTPTYDNSKFVFLSEYDWYYIKNGKKVEVKAYNEEEIPLGVLASTSIYIKVSSMTSTSSTSTVTETTTIPEQSVTISSTEPATTQTPPPTSTSTVQAKTVRYGFMWN